MVSSLPDPAPGYRWELRLPTAPTKRHPVRWIVGLVVIVLLAGGAYAVAEWLARDVTTNTVRGLVSAQLEAPPAHPIEVTLQGSVLFQLITGRIDDVRVTTKDAVIATLSEDATLAGDISLHVVGLPVRDRGPFTSGEATIALDQDQLRALMSTVDGFPADSLGLAAPDVTVDHTLTVLGHDFTVGIALTPGAADGDLVLTPSSFRLGDSEVAADDLRERFGRTVSGLLGDWSVCIASRLPKGVTLADVHVAGDRLVASFDVSGGMLNDSELQEKGTCE
ncbi:MAG: DUF2993 domain-containing protein [Microbacterium sp.]|uniref:LmeA family phospholipid-binding protein n=1 Tax=Microbacterium sp. TaxID=51671 RepID=UPI0039E613A4